MWDTGYGQALIAKIAILVVVLGLASVNCCAPRRGCRRATGARSWRAGDIAAAATGRGETFLVFGAIFAAGVMSSVAPPPKALERSGRRPRRLAPARSRKTVEEAGYRLELGVTPNRATRPNAFSVKLTKDGKPVTGADVVAKFTMLDMGDGPAVLQAQGALAVALTGTAACPRW